MQAFSDLEDEIRSLSPLNDGYMALSVTASGYGKNSAQPYLHVFYGDGLAFDVSSVDELRKKLAARDPERIRQERIAALERELEKLKAETAPVIQP